MGFPLFQDKPVARAFLKRPVAKAIVVEGAFLSSLKATAPSASEG
jgi:hypothetical protein